MDNQENINIIENSVEHVENNVDNESAHTTNNIKEIRIKANKFDTIMFYRNDDDIHPHLVLEFNAKSPMTAMDLMTAATQIDEIQYAKNMNHMQKNVKIVEIFIETFDKIFNQKDVAREILRYDPSGYKMEALYDIMQHVKSAIEMYENESAEEFKRHNAKQRKKLAEQAKADNAAFIANMK